MKLILHELTNGNKYFIKSTDAPRFAFIDYQQQNSQKVVENSLQLQT